MRRHGHGRGPVEALAKGFDTATLAAAALTAAFLLLRIVLLGFILFGIVLLLIGFLGIVLLRVILLLIALHVLFGVILFGVILFRFILLAESAAFLAAHSAHTAAGADGVAAAEVAVLGFTVDDGVVGRVVQ